MTVPAPLIRSVAAGLLAAAALAAGCGEAAHSQQVRREARDRYDRAGAQISYDQARQAFQSGQFQEALDQVDRAIARFPKEASYQLLRGRILHEMTRVEEAHRSFASAAELDPRKPEPHYFMGIIHQRWREHDRALASYAAAAKLDETKLHFVAAEVEMLTILGRHEDALARAQARWGVPPEIVVGIIGVETFYGRITGRFRIVDALATLAFDFPTGRSDRSPFFRRELE